MTDWRSATTAFAVAIGFGVLSKSAEQGLATRGTLIRFAMVAAAIGVLLALEDFEGESTAALPTPTIMRLGARLASILSVWTTTLAATLLVSGVESTWRLVTEAAVVCLMAVLLATIGWRTGIPGFTTVAAVALAALFVVTLILPARVNPWWDGINPQDEPSAVIWYIGGTVLALATFGVSRRIELWSSSR